MQVRTAIAVLVAAGADLTPLRTLDDARLSALYPGSRATDTDDELRTTLMPWRPRGTTPQVKL